MIYPYIVHITVELTMCTLVVQYTVDPERGEVGAMVEFTEVGNIQVFRYHDAGDVCYGDFEPIRAVSLVEGRSRFTMNTGDAVVMFEAASRWIVAYENGDEADWPALFAVETGAAE